MTVKERQEYFSNLVEKLGITNIWTAAGYILPDGSLLDMSNTDIYPDPAVRVYTHPDLKKFFGFDSEEIMTLGGIRIGYGDITEEPYTQIVLSEYLPTEFQYTKLEELLNTAPFTIDLELNLDLHNLETSFYKKYRAEENDINDIKNDLQAYINGDTTNYGHFNEKFGELDQTGDVTLEEESESESTTEEEE